MNENLKKQSVKNRKYENKKVAEISGDFHCEEGGIEAFLSENGRAVLYVDRLDYEQNMEKLQDVEILHENAGYLLLGK